MSRARVLTRLGTAALVAGALVGSPGPVAADTTFGRPTARAEYGDFVEFVQPARLEGEVARVEVLLELPGGPGPIVTEVAVPASGTPVTLRHRLELADGHLLPNTAITARWRVTAPDGGVNLGPAVTVRYEDTRFDWKVREDDIVRVHFYEGSDAFGRRALDIGARAVRETSALLGVTEDEPIDFFVYADQDAFYDALGPGTRENVGGQANTEIRTLFALITPGEIDDPWVETVIPHELVHLVFNTAVKNEYHFPPRWLNEGLAVFLSQGYDDGDRTAVVSAARDGSLIPLEGLTGQFPTTRDRFFLAYGESVAAVDYLVRTYGRDALVRLIRSYADGRTDDEAFDVALGVDVAGFEDGWRTELDAAEPTVYGPQPAPPGPLPPGWLGVGGSPAPTLAPGPGRTAGPGGPGAPTGSRDGQGMPVALGAGLALLVVAGAIVLLSRRRARPTVAVGWSDARWSDARWGVPPPPAPPSGSPPPALPPDEEPPVGEAPPAAEPRAIKEDREARP